MTEPIEGLENHYPGDAAWEAFANLVEEAKSTASEELIATCKGDVQLAMIIANVVGDLAIEWMNRQIPALDGLTPLMCLESAKLKKRLRSMLMRMP